MSFLAPLFLLGAAAIALPVVFHLIRLSPRIQRAFSSLMFLEASTPRLTKRSRLEHLLLLLLRCAVICLLAIAFARPFLNRPVPQSTPTAESRKVVVLLDTSASMQRDGLWEAAMDRALDIAGQCSAVDELALYTFDQGLTSRIRFEEWNAAPFGDRVSLVRERLSGLTPGWLSTSLDDAVIQASELLADGEELPTSSAGEIVVISDFQEGARSTDLQSYEWPKGIVVRNEDITPGASGNASLRWLPNTDQSDGLTVRFRVSNSADLSQEQFQVGWASESGDKFLGQPVEVYVPSGQSRVVTLPVESESASYRVALLDGDEASFDNRVFVIPPTRSKLKVVYLGSDDARDSSSPLYFLDRALPDTPGRQIEVIAANTESASIGSDLAGATLLVATRPLNESSSQAVRDWMQSGGTVLFAPLNVESALTLSRLIGEEQIPLTEFVPRDYSMLGEIDFRHPLFAPFADERFSDFTGIHFWKYRRLDLSGVAEAHVLARFDNDDPAVVQVPVGEGQLFLLASSWVPADSQLALSSKFVPLLFSLLELTGKASSPASQLIVGDSLPENQTGAGTVSMLATVEASETDLSKAESGMATIRPGVYSVQSPGSAVQFAVNLDPAESRTVPLPVDELERLGVPTTVAAPDPVHVEQRKVTLHQTELEARQKLWRWVIIAALVLLAVEMWLGGWTFRKMRPPERAST